MSSLLLSLRCPRCGNDMEGAGASRVYTCSPCGVARFMERPETLYPYVVLRPSREGVELLWAPFWRVEGDVQWQGASGEKTRFFANAKPLKALYFPAFSTLKLGQHENLTQRYALWEDPFVEEPRRELNLLPGLLDPLALPEMARLTWLAYLDRIADVTGLELLFSANRVSYAAVPFLRKGLGWEDGQIGIPYPDSYFTSSRL